MQTRTASIRYVPRMARHRTTCLLRHRKPTDVGAVAVVLTVLRSPGNGQFMIDHAVGSTAARFGMGNVRAGTVVVDKPHHGPCSHLLLLP
ncbi:MAG: hypothetical protein ABSG53_02365 [Thermoguttaceae bacterium]